MWYVEFRTENVTEEHLVVCDQRKQWLGSIAFAFSFASLLVCRCSLDITLKFQLAENVFGYTFVAVFNSLALEIATGAKLLTYLYIEPGLQLTSKDYAHKGNTMPVF
jgi:hypothetical protein